MIEAITVAKLLPLLAFVAIGVFFIDPANLVWTDVPDASAVLGTAGIVDLRVLRHRRLARSERRSEKPVAHGSARGPACARRATVLYLAIQFVALGIMGLDLANDGHYAAREAPRIAFGPAAADDHDRWRPSFRCSAT